MNVNDYREVNLFNDKLVGMMAAGKISYEVYCEIQLYRFWASQMKNKRLADPPPDEFNEDRERNNFYSESTLLGDTLSFQLKRFLNLVIGNPARLQLERYDWIKNRIWKLPSKKFEKEIIRRIMRNQGKIELLMTDTVSLINSFDECLDQNEVESLLNGLEANDEER